MREKERRSETGSQRQREEQLWQLLKGEEFEERAERLWNMPPQNMSLCLKSHFKLVIFKKF